MEKIAAMPVPPNIDIFNRFSLTVFHRLYIIFPMPVELDVHDLMMSSIPEDSSFDEAFDALQVGREALGFLSAEGFINHQGAFRESSGFRQVRLTMKGLTILGSVPTSLITKKPLISRILAATEKGIKNAAAEQVQALMNKVLIAALSKAACGIVG